MKQFFEQYGGVALGILALLVLIAMITPVGNIIKTSLQGTAETFSARIENQNDDAFESITKAQEMAAYGAIIDIPGTIVNFNGIDGTDLPNTWSEDEYIWPDNYNFGDTITLFAEIYIDDNDDFISRDQAIFGNWQGAGGGIVLKDGRVGAELYINGNYKTILASDFPLNEKFMIALTYDGNEMKLYINGNLKETMNISGNIRVSPYGFTLGNPNGTLESPHRDKNTINTYRVGLYDGALTEEQAKSLANR